MTGRAFFVIPARPNEVTSALGVQAGIQHLHGNTGYRDKPGMTDFSMTELCWLLTRNISLQLTLDLYTFETLYLVTGLDIIVVLDADTTFHA
ncbi:MAG: hypothetical protein BMS9Abin26_1476 [Gammaproteobacteria bacterium]|nr:MAG: hypothetical protein BMS9Abin26_1476 [Gammaproteobacteria bacterium]